MSRDGRIGPSVRVGPALAVLGLLAACGSAPPTASPTAPTAAATASPTATAVATVRRVEVAAAGLGSYLETTVPVVVVHNASAAEDATAVTVHITLTSATGVTTPGGAARVTLIPPGADVVVTTRIAGAHRGERVTAGLTVGAWTTAATLPPGVTVGTVQCASCARGGSGDVVVELAGSPAGGTLTVAVACRDAAGAILGGGTAVRGGAPGATVVVKVSVILSDPPVSCTATADPGGF